MSTMMDTVEPTEPAGEPLAVAEDATPKRSWWRRLLAPWHQMQTLKENVHFLLDLPVGIAIFTYVVTMLSLGFGMLITLIGFPILLFTVITIRWIGNFERARARVFLDMPDLAAAPSLAPRWHDADGNRLEHERGHWWRTILAGVTKPTFWKELLYDALILPWGIATFTVTVMVWSVALGLVSTPAWSWALSDNEQWTGGILKPAGWFVLGIVALVAAPWVIRGVAWLTRQATRGLLGTSAAELEAKIEHLSESRSRSVDAATAERQRIERALHDGAQMRLTSLAMELGRAKEKLASDPEGAAALIDEAHGEAKAALVELRDLARGIHPSVLTDRGLDAAVHALAARAPIPVDVTVDLPERPPPVAEATAYYVIAEGLTNVSRHAEASRATVLIRQASGRLVVEVQDDGRGGASIGAHDGIVPTGLRGLADRVAGVDGELVVTSPPGGPTVIRAEVPCG